MEGGALVATARFVADKVAILIQLDEKLKAMTGIEEKMKKLKEMSTIIDMVIEDVESHPLNKDAVKDLLRKLKYLAYDLEDVVDCYDTEALRRQRSSIVTDFFSSNNQVGFTSKIRDMIQLVTNSLDSILLQKSILLNLPQSSSHMSPNSYRETHSRNSFDVIGREPEKNEIVNMLTDDDDDDDESSHGTLKVITIVGMGGLGKTTLAQLVFNDEKVKAHFESSRLWTVVGAEFDPAKIMKSILELATGALVNISQIDAARQKIEKELSGKKFLLVLDDVWNEDPLKWRILKTALTCGARGSRILVTTRSQEVSKIMGSSNTTHQIQQLSKDDCLSLFQQFAFGDEEVDPSLMEIGGKIVKKCGGVPLAAISLGSMLRITRDETYWSSVLKSEIWQLRDEKQKEDKVLAVLKLSYDTLPSRSKKCFAFASLYSKNYWMPKDELIKLWIANGFVHSEGNFDAETTGNRVLEDLVMRSFFLLAPSRDFEYDSHETKYTMHDLMHDLGRSVSADVYWHSEQDSVEDIGNRTYHLQIDLKEESSMTQVLGKKPLYLRTFMSLYGFSRLNIHLLEVFSEFKFLRALDLTYGGMREVPTSIGNLILLRYLNLSKNNIEVLTDSITLLSNLQYLDLNLNHKLRELPKELGNMQKLRHLNLSGNNIQVLPDSITLLSNLQYLNLNSNGKFRELPKELGNIQKLRDLNLSGNNIQVLPDSIIFLSNLQYLNLSSNGKLRELPKELGNMQKLQDLNLCGNNIEVIPDSITLLSNLQYLNLSFNRELRELPKELGNMQKLRDLNLSRNNIQVLPDSITLLSNLQYLNLSSNRELRNLPKELGNMQNLRDLDLQYNLDLTHMPCGLSRLTNLRSLPLFIDGGKTGTCSIIDLEDLKLHGGMTIKFSQDFINYSCCGRKILKNKDLNELYIQFNGSERYDQGMLNDLCPNTSLKKLGIWHYGSPQFPTWLIELQLPNLVEVNLDCDCERIPSFGNLQFLKKLHLYSMKGISQMGAEFHYGGFPSLEELCLYEMDNLEEWSESDGVDELFPLLQRLKISDCPKLKSMPRLPRIQYLEISCCSGSILSCIGRLTSLSVLRVNDMGDMTSLPSGCIRNLTSLTKLEITYCRELQSLPGDEMQHLAMLQSLSIDRCKNLASFPSEVGRLSSLRYLYLRKCPSMIVQPEILVQILNSIHEFQIDICGNKVNLSGQLQYLHTLKKLSLYGAHGVNDYRIANLRICCCEELESLMTTEAASSSVLEQLYIDGISNLTILPDWLQHLKSLSSLEIRNCP